jgi:hypothetical protein
MEQHEPNNKEKQGTKLFPLPADIGAVSTVQYQVFLDKAKRRP